MLPLHDVHQPKRVPLVTRLLIVLNVMAFAYQGLWWLMGQQGVLETAYGVRPQCYVAPWACGINPVTQGAWLWQPLLVAPFLHGGLLHLAFNMLFLWVFGPAVEARLGRLQFLAFYLGCGIAASLAQIVTHPFDPAPMIGASGAISGVLGAYLILQPRSWILTYLPPIFVFPVPAPLFLVLWVVYQVTSVVSHLPWLNTQPEGQSVAWVAHLGGFAAGVAVGWLVQPWWRKRAAH